MKLIISILVICPLIFSYSIGLFHVLEKISFTSKGQLWFYLFFTMSFLLNHILRKQMSYWSIFKHELTHNIFAILTLNEPLGFTVKRNEGGRFEYNGRGNFLITLSPYFFPTITSFVLLISLFNNELKLLFYIVLGLAAGFDLSSLVKDIHPFQSDLRKFGYKFSILIVIFGILFFWGILLCFINGGWDFSADYIKYGILKLISEIIEIANIVL